MSARNDPRSHDLSLRPGRHGRRQIMLAAALAGTVTLSPINSCPAEQTSWLRYDAASRGAVPVPPPERALQTVVAEPYVTVSDAPIVLEGPAFDREGNLLFVDATHGRVLRLSQDRQLSVVVDKNDLGASGLAVHRDGRVFIAAVGDMRHGSIRAVEPDGSGMRMIVGPEAGYLPNDLVFDQEGGFYFTDSRGNATDLTGGVYHVTPNFQTISPVLPRLGVANGIALGPDDKELWATEHGRNALHRVRLAGPATIAPFGSTIAYQFIGPAADSMRADRDGNVYVAITGQGRVLVFNRNGLPIGQILLPGRDEGRNLKSTSLALRPGSRELFIVTSNGTEAGGAAIFRAGGFAEALPLFSHR